MPGSSCWVDSLKMWIELNVKGNSDRSIATVWVPKWSLEKKKQIKICWVVEGKGGEKCREGEVARASKVQPRNGREGRAQRDGVRVTLLSVKALQLAQLLPHLPPPPLPTPILSVLYSLFWGEASLGGEGYNTLYLWSIMPHATSLYRTRYHTTTSSPLSLLAVYFPHRLFHVSPPVLPRFMLPWYQVHLPLWFWHSIIRSNHAHPSGVPY